MRSNKRFFDAAMGLALAASMTLPYAAGAQSATGTPSQAEIAGFCKGLAAMTAKVEGRLVDGSGKIAAKRGAAETRLDGLKKAHEDKLVELRSKEDTKRSGRVAELEAIADSEEERQALRKFQTAVAAAVDARRAATDMANDAFRDGLKGLIAARRSAIDAATGTFAAAVRTALAKADTDCSAGLAPAKVRQNLLDALKAAREALQEDLKDVAKIGPQVQPLIETRRSAHRKAMDGFHADLDAAKTELKTAFGA